MRAGQLTATGRRLATLGWSPPVESVERGARLVRGNREYVRLPSGREALTRTWRKGAWELTATGRQPAPLP